VLVTPGILVQVLWYEPHKTEDRRYITDNVQCWLFWLAANLLISWYLAVLVDLVPTVIRYFLAAVWGHVSESVKSRLELYINVKNTLKPVLYASSAWISWLIIFVDIFALYDVNNPWESRAPYLYRVSLLYMPTALSDFHFKIYQVVQFVFFLALVICVQTMLSHAIGPCNRLA
jgi:hypothetical protein